MTVKNFELIAYILDKDKKVIRLQKKEDFEVRWKGNWGKGKKEIVFNKDGENYRILVVVLLEKYLLGARDTVAGSKFFVPTTAADYRIYEGYMGEPGNSPEKDRERWDSGVVLNNQWNWGRIVIYLIIIIVIVAFVSWIFKKRKRGFPRTP